MPVQAGLTLPFSAECSFDIAADVERYPQFLKGWHAVKVISRHDDTLRVVQDVGIGPARLIFASEAVLNRPRSIEVTCLEAPFKRLRLSWNIAATTPTGCHVIVAADFVMRSPFLQVMIDGFLPAMIDDLLRTFRNRAVALYSE